MVIPVVLLADGLQEFPPGKEIEPLAGDQGVQVDVAVHDAGRIDQHVPPAGLKVQPFHHDAAVPLQIKKISKCG